MARESLVSSPWSPVAAAPNRRAGFALLITITLLAFLVVLLVGLASYTRVETAIAGNTQRQTQARQNALTALNVALGQLQKYAGPDQRVTATADAFGGTGPTKHYTGVWDTTQPATATPITWLVSGNEFLAGGAPAPTSVTPTTSLTTTNSAELVGTHSVGTARDVAAPLVPITSVGVPGVTNSTATTIGRYAWWIGDQGVKAPVALGDPTTTAANFNYAPYDSAEVLSRIRQQISLGAGPADAAGAPAAEPRDTNNASLVANGKVTAFNQLAFLRIPTASTPLGLTQLQKYFHAWSPNNFNVLANTSGSPSNLGLRQDLSLFSPSNPSPLGAAYDAWVNYDPATGGYMEDPAAPANPQPLPALTADPLRRRYSITTPVSAGSIGVSPVLSYFYLMFGVRKQTAAAPYTLSVRWAAALWNPYSSALVPEDLRLEISGLPTSVTFAEVDTNSGTATDDVTVNLRTLYGDPLKVTLPWVPSSSPVPSEVSWLPGRVYNWAFLQNASLSVGGDNPGDFNSRSLGAFADGLIVSVPGSARVNGSSQLAVRVASQTRLVVKLKRRNGDLLATYNSPTYDAVPLSDHGAASNNTSQLGFLFRLAESFDTPATPEIWLTTAGRDPRSDQLPTESLVAVPNGPNPANYRNFVTVRAPDRLLDRDITTGTSYNEDAPLFELPRAPVLSVGELQHLYIGGARPFSIGNSWGSGTSLNGINIDELFDRFYFSGLVSGANPPTVNGSLLLPNPLIKVLPRNSATGAAVSLADLQQMPSAQSSKFMLQGGAFNLNSVNPAAWEAVLRSVRFPAPRSFKYLDADATTGTAADNVTASIQSTDAQFFRFAHSAQEVFKADDDYIQSTSGSEQDVINTPLFRRGMRTLSPADVSALATIIANAITAHQSTTGPFRTLEEFLKPASPGAPSLLEQAISDAAINSNIAEFSSQWLTQGDIMTALAPVLFPRSDTFVIRTYGEAVNPTTGGTEGRAWCEATVQRVPEYYNKAADAEEIAPAALTDTMNQTFGRRFKIVSFRWLTRSDI